MATWVYRKEVRAHRQLDQVSCMDVDFNDFMLASEKTEKDEANTDRPRGKDRTTVITEIAETASGQLICILCYLWYICQTDKLSDGWRNSLNTQTIQTAQRREIKHWRGRNSLISRQLWQEQIQSRLAAGICSCSSTFFQERIRELPALMSVLGMLVEKVGAVENMWVSVMFIQAQLKTKWPSPS